MEQHRPKTVSRTDEFYDEIKFQGGRRSPRDSTRPCFRSAFARLRDANGYIAKIKFASRFSKNNSADTLEFVASNWRELAAPPPVGFLSDARYRADTRSGEIFLPASAFNYLSPLIRARIARDGIKRRAEGHAAAFVMSRPFLMRAPRERNATRDATVAQKANSDDLYPLLFLRIVKIDTACHGRGGKDAKFSPRCAL